MLVQTSLSVSSYQFVLDFIATIAACTRRFAHFIKRIKTGQAPINHRESPYCPIMMFDGLRSR